MFQKVLFVRSCKSRIARKRDKYLLQLECGHMACGDFKVDDRMLYCQDVGERVQNLMIPSGNDCSVFNCQLCEKAAREREERSQRADAAIREWEFRKQDSRNRDSRNRDTEEGSGCAEER